MVLILSEIIILNSFSKTDLLREREVNGTQNGILINVSNDKISELEHDQAVKKVGLVYNFAVCDFNNSADTAKITIGHIDNTTFILSNISVLEGRLPSKKNEIALEKSTCYKLKISPEINQRIILNLQYLQDGNYSEPKSQEYIISGILSDYSEIQTNQFNIKAGYESLPGILAYKLPENQNYSSAIQAMVLLKDNENIKATFDNFINMDVALKYSLNTIVYPDSVESHDRADTIGFLRTIFIIFVNLFAFICFVAVNFIIGKSKAEKSVRALLAGATKNQVMLINLIQQIAVFVVALPISLLIGVFLGYIPALFINYVFSIPMNLIVISLSIVFLTLIVVTIIVTNAALKSTRFNLVNYKQKRNKTNKSTGSSLSIKNPVVLWSIKYYKANLGSFIFPCVAFALSILVFSFAIFMYNANNDEFSKNKVFFDYNLSYYEGLSVGALRIPTNISTGFTDGDYFSLKSNSDIKKIWAVKETPFNIIVNEKNQFVSQKYAGNISLEPEYNKEEYAQALKTYHYDEKDKLYLKYLRAFDDDTINQLEKYKISGDIDLVSLNSAKGVIVCTTEKNADLKVGDEITFTQLVPANFDDFEIDNVKKVLFTVKVEAICFFAPETSEAEIFSPYKLDFIWGMSSLNSLEIQTAYNTIYMQLSDSEAYLNVDKDIASLKSIYPNMSYESRHQLADYYRDLQSELLSICFFVVTILLIGGCLNNSVIFSASIRVRWRQFGLNMAAGMTKTQIRMLIYVEALITSAISWILGLVLSTLLCGFLGMNADINFIDFIPWSVFILSLPTIALICLLSTIVPFNSLKKVNIIKMIRMTEA